MFPESWAVSRQTTAALQAKLIPTDRAMERMEEEHSDQSDEEVKCEHKGMALWLDLARGSGCGCARLVFLCCILQA